jgi:hypothetical protein
MKKYLLGLFAIILAVAFSSFSNSTTNSKKAFTTYYFQWNGSSYDNAVVPTGQLPTTTKYCTNTISNQCDGGFSAVTDLGDNGDGTHTFAPSGSPTVLDYIN